MKPMMKCGHVASGTTGLGGDPVCLLDVGITPDALEVAGPPDLTGRMARCTCERDPVPSAPELAFFEYRGDGSPAALNHCATCAYYEVAHEGKRNGVQHLQLVCDEFVAHGAYEFDSYYCGHAGWD